MMPLFFPQSEPNIECKKKSGLFNEHIEGRKSEWAANRKVKGIDRNYAAFLMAPPITSFSQIRPFFFIYQDIQIPPTCIDAVCHLTAAAWIRVDKIWGDENLLRLLFTVELADKEGIVKESFEYNLDPFHNQNWQLASLDQQIAVSKGIEMARIALKIRCNVGAIFADDFYLSINPI